MHYAYVLYDFDDEGKKNTSCFFFRGRIFQGEYDSSCKKRTKYFSYPCSKDRKVRARSASIVLGYKIEYLNLLVKLPIFQENILQISRGLQAIR